MKFKTTRSVFLDALKSVQNVVPAKASAPVIQNVLIEAENGRIEMRTTDIDISVKVSFSCEVIEEGKTTLPVKYLFNVVQKVAEGDIDIEVDSGDNAVILASSAKIRLAGISSSLFPPLPEEDDSFIYTVPSRVLRDMLKKTVYAASQDDTRRNLKSVLMSFKNGKLTLVATDGRRLALVENEVEFPENESVDIVLPLKTATELLRSLSEEGEVKIKVQKTQISFKTGNIQLYSKLISENYPNYSQVIPEETGEKIKIDRQQLIEAVERASVLTLDELHSVKLIFDSNRLVIMSASTDIGDAKDEIPVKYCGEKIEIMFNPNYLLDPLKVIEDDEVTINLNSGHKPAVIKCGVPFIYVLMPLRVN